jgi:hypothetical protein
MQILRISMKSGDRRSLRSFSSEVFASALPESVGYKKEKTPEGVFCFVGGAEGNRRFAPPESVGLINE